MISLKLLTVPAEITGCHPILA